ncbi:hypothetical protein A9Q84_17480 [Halobacteriovorax marinus]|uniref:Uncharacterized protein n=1 Tax=Halobacteriovorax marinus TaxID=97084 RepID=A0A1Y5F3F1_9BACT|nr:hypothetical protein A9Q84_17480 [Halobacteriovorax marinus]
MDEVDKNEEHFMPVNIDIIRANCPFTFDLYIKVNEKYIHYIRKGDDMAEGRLESFKKIQKLKQKDVQRLFCPKEDREEFEGFIDEEIDEALTNENLDEDEKFDIINDIATAAVEVNFEDPESQEAYNLTLKAAKGLRKVVSDNPKALTKLFSKKKKKTEKIQQHCSNVAAIALKIAFSCGFRGDDLDNLGAACLLHDIGLKQMKQDDIDILFPRPKNRLKPNDKLIYKDHVAEGIRILSKKDFVNPNILKLIESHEEELGGGGYPNKVDKPEPLSQILGISNRFDKKVTFENLEIAEAFSSLKTEEIGNFELKYFEKLKEVVKAMV